MSEPGTSNLDWSEEEGEFFDFLRELCQPPSREPTEDWAEKYVIVQKGPFAGSLWRLQFTPFAKWIFEAARTPGVKRITIMMSAQYVKTTVMIVVFLRNSNEDPADAMWVMAEADQIDEFWSGRLQPYIEDCEPLAPKLVGKRKAMAQFESMNLFLRGSNSTAKLQSESIKVIYCDERREWKPGAIEKLRKRLRTFPNALEISAGTAGNEGGELHIDWKDGSQERAHFCCLKCGHSQPYRFSREQTSMWPARECGGFIWETSERTKPNGIWNWALVEESVRLECENPNCREQYKNSQKYDLLRTMHAHAYNPAVIKEHRSFSGSAFEAVWESCDWGKLVVEFLKAVEAAKEGNIEPMRAFVTETLGEVWQDRLGVIDDFGFLEGRQQKYQYGEKWAEERRRFMFADKQAKGGEHYYWLIRSFGSFGKSRLVAFGRCNTYAELEQIRRDYNVPINDAMIDSGFKARGEAGVYRFCLNTGWKPFKGDDAPWFLYRDTRLKKTVRRIWNWTDVDPYMGTAMQGRRKLRLFMFSGDATKDLLFEYIKGLVGEWTVVENPGRQYYEHLSAEKRVEEVDSRGHISHRWVQVRPDNHWLDCEVGIMAAAVITGTIKLKDEPPKKQPVTSALPTNDGGASFMKRIVV